MVDEYKQIKITKIGVFFSPKGLIHFCARYPFTNTLRIKYSRSNAANTLKKFIVDGNIYLGVLHIYRNLKKSSDV